MGAPIVLEANSKIRHLASLRTKDPDMRFFTVIVEHEPMRWEINQVVHITADEIFEVQVKTYLSKDAVMADFHLFRSKALEEMQEAGIEVVYDEYPVPDMPQDKQISYIKAEFSKEMGFDFKDRRPKL